MATYSIRGSSADRSRLWKRQCAKWRWYQRHGAGLVRFCAVHHCDDWSAGDDSQHSPAGSLDGRVRGQRIRRLAKFDTTFFRDKRGRKEEPLAARRRHTRPLPLRDTSSRPPSSTPPLHPHHISPYARPTTLFTHTTSRPTHNSLSTRSQQFCQRFSENQKQKKLKPKPAYHTGADCWEPVSALEQTAWEKIGKIPSAFLELTFRIWRSLCHCKEESRRNAIRPQNGRTQARNRLSIAHILSFVVSMIPPPSYV